MFIIIKQKSYFVGQILKIKKGKYECQYIILLRNSIGPVLQAFYYEIDQKLPSLEIGMLYLFYFYLLLLIPLLLFFILFRSKCALCWSF